jgi:hypothetical protein
MQKNAFRLGATMTQKLVYRLLCGILQKGQTTLGVPCDMEADVVVNVFGHG